MANFGEVTFTGTTSANVTVWFALVATSGSGTTVTLLGSTTTVQPNNLGTGQPAAGNFAFQDFVPVPTAGTT